MLVEVDKHRGLDTGYSWVIMMATFGGFFVCAGLLQTAGIMNTAFLERYGEDVSRTATASPVGTLVIDRGSCRVALVTSGLLMSVGCIITAFSPNIEVCILAFGGISGLGAGIAYNCIFVVCGFNFKKRLNLAIGVAQTGAGSGLFVLAPVMEYIKAEYGYTGFFLMLSGLCLQLVVMGTLMRPSVLEKELQQKRLSKQLTEHASSECSTIIEILGAYMCMFRNKSVVCLSVSMFMFFGGIYGMFVYWPSLCIAYGLSPMQGSLVLSLIGIMAIFGRLLTGMVASHPAVEEYVVHVGSLAIVAVILILFQFYPASFAGNIVTAITIGIVYGSCFVVISAINIKCVGVQYISAAIGLEFVIGGIGSIVIPVFSGYLINGGWQYKHVFVFCGGCIALASLLALAPRVFQNDVIKDAHHSEQQDIVIVAEKNPFITENHIDDGIEAKRDSFIIDNHIKNGIVAARTPFITENQIKDGIESVKKPFITENHIDDREIVISLN